MSYTTIAIYIATLSLGAVLVTLGGWWVTVRLFNRLRHRLSFDQFVAVRHLKGRKSGFVTVIGAFSILGVSFSSCTLTTVLSVMGGFSNDLKVKILKTNAHVVVDAYGVDLEDWRPLLDRIQAFDPVTAATPLVQSEMMINARTNNHAIQLKGIDTASFVQVSQVLDQLDKGKLEYIAKPHKLFEEVRRKRVRMFGGDEDDEESDTDTADDEPDSKKVKGLVVLPPVSPRQRVLPPVIVGRELAKALRLYVGEEVNIISPLGDIGPTGPIPKSRPFRVGGIFFSGMYEFDSLFAYTSLKEAQKFLRKGDRISEIHVAVEDSDRSREVAALIRGDLGGDYRVRSWEELNASLFSALKLEKIVMFIFLSMAILVASFCIVATLTMLVLEKGAEISVLMTLGASKQRIQHIFRFEGLLIGVVGTISGLLIGAGLCMTLDKIGLPIDPEVWYIDKLPVKMEWIEFTLVGAASMMITQLATIYPTLAAARLTPVEGLKNGR